MITYVAWFLTGYLVSWCTRRVYRQGCESAAQMAGWVRLELHGGD